MLTAPELSHTYIELPASLHRTAPVIRGQSPQMLLANTGLATEIGIDPDWLGSNDAITFLTASDKSAGDKIIAMAYAGHQFGYLNPQLGDGRAALLGELVTPGGVRVDLQLKGSGRTYYSRGGDGKATLRAALKEYLFSESLAALGIDATRSLAVITTGETVAREHIHPGAILVRTARSHVRVGTFQYAKLLQEDGVVKALADYVIAREYPEVAEADRPYRELLAQVIERQANLVAGWMSVGFIHGVMNTDNMAISGESIDFGPCAFMEYFSADRVYSSIDENGRYAWNRQADIALWNLSRLAEAMLELLHAEHERAVEIAEQLLGQFSPMFMRRFNQKMAEKMGVDPAADDIESLISDLFQLLQNAQPDFTKLFRTLLLVAGGGDKESLLEQLGSGAEAVAWYQRWRGLHKAGDNSDARVDTMARSNPVFIPRLHLAEAAFEQAESGDLSVFNRLLQAVQNPYEEQPDFADLAEPPAPEQTALKTFCET